MIKLNNTEVKSLKVNNLNSKKSELQGNISNEIVLNSQSFTRTKSKSLIKPKEQKKKQFTKKDEDEIAVLLKNLNIVKEQQLIDEFIAGNFKNYFVINYI